MTAHRIAEAPARQAFERALREHEQSFGSFFLAKLFGFELAYDSGTCRVSFEARDFMFNPQGSLHGGIIALAMDVSMGHWLMHRHGAGTTLEMKTQYLRPVKPGRVTATGRALQEGKSIFFLESTLRAEDGEPKAFATATWKLMAPASATGLRTSKPAGSGHDETEGRDQ
jgi:acyl-CoA thioesterase